MTVAGRLANPAPMAHRLLLLLIGLAPCLAWAAPSLDVSVDRTAVALGDRLTLTATLLSDRAAFGGPRLQEPQLDGFAVVGRMSFSSFDSRARQNQLKLQLTLSPLKAGQLTIGAFRYPDPSGPVTSEPVRITVTAPSGGGGPTPGAAPGTADPNGAAAPDAEQAPDRLAFLRWEIDTTDLWLGQQVRARLNLYVNRQVSVRNFNASDINPQGFWTQDRAQRDRPKLVQLGNEVFTREALWDQHIFPIRAGTLTLPAVDATMLLSSRGLGRRQTQEVTRRVEAVPLTVKRLPTDGRPANFSGPAVGQVRIEAASNGSKVKAEDGLQLTVTTRVDGLIQNVPAIELPSLDGLKVFPPSETTNTSVRGDSVVGIRRQTWLLRPTRTGRLQIPALTLPYFDPATGRYATARSRPVWLTVTGQPATDAAPDSAAAAAASAPDGPALRTIRKAPTLESTAAGPAYRHPLLWLAAVLPPLALLGLILAGRVRRQRASTAGSRAARNAAKVATEALGRAGKAAPRAAYTTLAQTLERYLETRFAQPFKGLTHAGLTERLTGLGVREETAAAAIHELENCDFARFAPGSGADDVSEAAGRMAALIARIEEEAAG